jgi:hypothetical protein
MLASVPEQEAHVIMSAENRKPALAFDGWGRASAYSFVRSIVASFDDADKRSAVEVCNGGL